MSAPRAWLLRVLLWLPVTCPAEPQGDSWPRLQRLWHQLWEQPRANLWHTGERSSWPRDTLQA